MMETNPLLRDLTALAADILTGEDPAAYFAGASFVGLGGDSLRAARLAGEARDKLGIAVAVEELLSDRPVSDVLASASSAVPASSPPAAAQSAPPPAGLSQAVSPTQRGMWIREQMLGSSLYNLVFTCLIDGPLREDILEAAVNATIRRHDGLRTVFSEGADGVERQVLGSFTLPLDRHPYDGSGEEFEHDAHAMAARLGRVPFDLSLTPPLRCTLVSRHAHQHALIFAVHHMLLDGWAIGLVLREIFNRYESLDAGLRLELGTAVGFDTYLRRQETLGSSGEFERQRDFWKRHLDGAPTVLDLPADRVRPHFQEAEGARIPVDLGPELSARVSSQASRLGITAASFLLAAFGLTVSRYTGAETMLIGMPVASRPTGPLADLVALTVNLLPARIEVCDEKTVGDYLMGVQQSLASSLSNADLPFDQIVSLAEESGNATRHPLVQVAFGMHDGLIPHRLRSAKLDIRIEEDHVGGAQFDAELFIRQITPSIVGDLEYATSIWRRSEAVAFCADLAEAVRELTGEPSALLACVRCIAPRRRAFLNDVNETSAPYPQSSIDAIFRDQARRTPDAVAVRAGERTLSYAALARAASVQARMLIEVGVSPGDTVLVTLERSIAETVAVLGIVWAGAAYVGVDQGTPAARLDAMVSVVHPAAVIGDSPLASSLRRVPAWDGSHAWEGSPPSASELTAGEPDPDRVACVPFTSGSTGKPKGVSIPHRGVIRLIAGLDRYAPVGPRDRFLRLSSLSFDISHFELWGALLNGAALEIYPPGIPSPADLGRFIDAHGVTVAWLTSGLFRLVSEYAVEHLGGFGTSSPVPTWYPRST